MLDRISILRAFFGQNSHAAADVSRRWMHAFAKDPDLARDLIAQGGLWTQQPVTMNNGYPQPAPIDPYRLAYEAGRRDLATLLLAQGGLTITEMNELMEETNVH